MSIKKDKKGIATLGLFLLVIMGFAVLIIMATLSYGMSLVDDSLSDLTFDLGNSSFNETYQKTFQIGILAQETTFPKIADMIAAYSSYFENEAQKYGFKILNTDANFNNTMEKAITYLLLK